LNTLLTSVLKSILMNFDCGGVRPKLLYVAKVGPPSTGTVVEYGTYRYKKYDLQRSSEASQYRRRTHDWLV